MSTGNPLPAACLLSTLIISIAGAQITNPGFEANPFTTGWSASGVVTEAGLNGSSVSARLPYNSAATLSQSFASQTDFTFDASVAVAGNTTPQSFRILLDSPNGTAIEILGALGNNLQLNSGGTYVALTSLASGAPFPFGTNQTLHLRIIGRSFGTPAANYDLAWSDPGQTSLVHAATHLSAFANPSAATAAINAVRFDRINPAAHSYWVDDVTITGSVSTPPTADYRLILPAPPKIVNISGIYPHLATTNSAFECGIGAVVPWQGDLWAITYSDHRPTGSDDKLYQISTNLTRNIRPESIGGTPANRFIHTPSNQLIIGPYFISASKNVRALPYSITPGRHTAVAAHLTDPANRVYLFTMEDGLYDVNVNDLSVIVRYPDMQSDDPFLFGYHGKGAYTGGGKLFVANNGRQNDQANPAGPSGVLASWDGSVRGTGNANPQWMTKWDEYARVQHCELTGPGGIYGNSSSSDPVWATGFDTKSVLLQTYENGAWNTWRLPKSSRTHDASHGWYTEWPRIREISPGKLLMHMHGLFYDFPKTFSLANFSGLSPICSYFKMPVDYCSFDGRLVISKNDSSIFNDKLVGRSQSNFWFGKPEDLKQWGDPQGHGTLWQDDALAAGQTSDPFLIQGFTNGTLHLRNDGANPLPLELQISNGTGGWQSYRNVTIAANSYHYELLESMPSSWLRLVAGAAATKATATIFLSNPYSHATPASLATSRFAALADIRDDHAISDGIIRTTTGTDLKLELASTHIAANKSLSTSYQQIGGSLALETMVDAASEASLRTKAALTKDFGSDAASAWVTIAGTGEKLRLPKIDPLYDTAFGSGWPRGFREAVTERSLLNCAGTFYEVPGDMAGGRRKLQPITTHAKRITDFTSWRGMLALTGVLDSAPASDSVTKSADGNSALWLGEIDDIWRMGEPRGTGGPWLNSTVTANAASDAYLMYGYHSKSLALSHQSTSAVTFTIEVDFLANNTWSKYASFTVAPGETFVHRFPDAFQAHWIRVSSNTATTASAQFTYGPAAARDRFLDWARAANLSTGAGRPAVAANDEDHDGNPALLEYVLGTDPGKADPLPQTADSGSFETIIRNDLAADGISCAIETSADLASWSPLAGGFLPAPNQTSVPAGFTRMRIAIDPHPQKCFFRVRASCP